MPRTTPGAARTAQNDRLHLKIAAVEKARLERAARHDGLTLSAWVRRALLRAAREAEREAEEGGGN